VRSLVDAEESVAGTRAYQPYGAPLTSIGAAESVYGFTGEQTDPTGLVYLRARMYAPGLGVLLSRDEWLGSHFTSLTLNSYLYTLANPVGFIDPSGYQVELPSDDEILRLLEQYRYIFTEQYGWFDMGHAAPKNPLLNQVKDRAKTGGEIMVGGEVAPPFSFIAYYWIEKLDEHQIEGVALGVMRDYDFRFERWQGEFPIGLGSGTSFAIEDLPSNYVGFITAVRKQGQATNVDVAKLIIEYMGPVKWTNESPPHSDDPPFDCRESIICALKLDEYVEQVKNYDYSPRVQVSAGAYSDIALGAYSNIAWPCDDFIIQPIDSGPETWHFVRQEHNRNVLTYLKYAFGRIKPW
jgi:RHS repeat-associated protein